MLDPKKKLTPLQRRRLKDGLPITSRQMSEVEIKHEDEKDKAHAERLKKKLPERYKEDIVELEYRMEERHAEHVRRGQLAKSNKELEEEAAEAKENERREADERERKQRDDQASAERQKRLEGINARFPDDAANDATKPLYKPVGDDDDYDDDDLEAAAADTEAAAEEARQREIEQERLLAEAAASVERERLEAMVDEAVAAEERRLRSLLDVGTPDNLENVTRRLRANDPRLIKVTLRQNDIGVAQASKLADAIARNTTMLAMDFRYNKIGDYGCKLIADALQTHPAIGELRLEPNDTGRLGRETLMEAARLCSFEAMSISSATLAVPEDSFSPIFLRAPQYEENPEDMPDEPQE